MSTIRRPRSSLWTASSMLRVLPGTNSAEGVTANDTGLRIRLDMARGERTSFQILIRPTTGNTLRNVRVETSDLSHNGSGERITAGHVQWHHDEVERRNEDAWLIPVAVANALR